MLSDLATAIERLTDRIAKLEAHQEWVRQQAEKWWSNAKEPTP